jgi:hypothetical protein
MRRMIDADALIKQITLDDVGWTLIRASDYGRPSNWVATESTLESLSPEVS